MSLENTQIPDPVMDTSRLDVVSLKFIAKLGLIAPSFVTEYFSVTLQFAPGAIGPAQVEALTLTWLALS